MPEPCTKEREIEMMSQKIDRIYNAIVGDEHEKGMRGLIEHLQDDLDSVRKNADKHHVTLYGNGKIGLVEEVRYWKRIALVSLVVLAGNQGGTWILRLF